MNNQCLGLLIPLGLLVLFFVVALMFRKPKYKYFTLQGVKPVRPETLFYDPGDGLDHKTRLWRWGSANQKGSMAHRNKRWRELGHMPTDDEL